MDPLHLAIALLPLAGYLVFLAVIAFARRPVMVAGSWDTFALALGLSGWIIVGPFELFLPDMAVARFGTFVAIPLLLLYILVVLLIVLLLKPRLAIYNITSEQLRPLLAEAVGEIDDRARWAGDCLTLPNAGVQLYLETQPGARHVEVLSVGNRQDFESWRKLSKLLAPRLRELPVAINPRGASLIASAAAIVVATGVAWATRRQEVADAFRDLFMR